MKPGSKQALSYRAPTQLSRMVTREGGVHRDIIIARAAANVEAMREEFMDVLYGLIEQLAQLAADTGQPAMQRLEAIEQLGDQIITLSGTYGLVSLQEAAMRLCDLTMALIARQEMIQDAVIIHINAVRLFGPRNDVSDAATAAKVLSDLRRVQKHFNIEPPGLGAAAPAA